MDTQQEPKYKAEGSRIVNRLTGETIPDDEPVFIFRARDLLALPALRKYHEDLLKEDRVSHEHVRAVNTRIVHFLEFRQQHPERMKYPDTNVSSKF
jgi:hypothetical protein